VIKPKHNSLYHKIFDVYFRYLIGRDFREVGIIGDFIPHNRSIFLLPNHFSWWDGFFTWELNRMHLHKKFYLMMLESELNKYKFFSKLGAFSIDSTSKGLLESLRYASNVLKQPGNLMVFFPQGKLYSQHHMALEFQKGIERIVANSHNFRLLMCANLIDYYAYRKPSLNIYIQEFERLTDFDLMRFQITYNLFLKQSIHKQDTIHRQ